jgi:putative oxidoreductase
MKFANIKYSDTSISLATLVLRLALGILMISHGYDKLIHFSEYSHNFSDPFHLGSTISLSLDIFAELFCSSLIVAGLFTRLACIPLIVAMCVALFYAHHGQIFSSGEKDALYLAGYFALLFSGPGKISMDRLIGK